MRITIFILFFFTLISCDFHSVEYYNKKSDEQAYQGNYQEAIVILNKALTKDPKNIISLLNRGGYKSFIKDFNGAIEDFSTVILIAPNNTLAQFQRGKNKYYIKDYSGAIADFNVAIETKGGISVYLEKVKNEFVETGYQFDVKMEEIRLERGFAEYDNNNVKAAYEDFKFCLTRNYEVPTCHYMIGMIYISIKENEKGCKSLKKSKDLGDPYAQEMINKYCN